MHNSLQHWYNLRLHSFCSIDYLSLPVWSSTLIVTFKTSSFSSAPPEQCQSRKLTWPFSAAPFSANPMEEGRVVNELLVAVLCLDPMFSLSSIQLIGLGLWQMLHMTARSVHQYCHTTWGCMYKLHVSRHTPVQHGTPAFCTQFIMLFHLRKSAAAYGSGQPLQNRIQTFPVWRLEVRQTACIFLTYTIREKP